VANDVGESLAHDPAEQFLVVGVDDVDGPRKVGGDACRPEQLAPRGELSSECHVAVIANRGPDVGERAPGQVTVWYVLDTAREPRSAARF
jgi:hypothetical protein